MKKTIRQSNFELLRILAIVLIIVHHIFVHAVRVQLLNTSMYSCGEMFNNFLFYKKLLLTSYAASFGKIGVNIFILISGYFLCSKKNINILKVSKKLIGQLIFATLILILCSFTYVWLFDKSFIGSVTLGSFNGEYWFIGYYFLIVLFGKLFLNNFLSKLSKQKYLSLLVSTFALISFLFTSDIMESVGESLSIVLTGLLLYSLGGYIKKYNPFKNVKSWVFILLIIMTFAFMALSYRNFVIADINNSIANGCYYQNIYLYSERSLVCLIISVCLFELFVRIKMKPNNIINYVASSTLITYMIHDNDLVHKLFLKIDWINIYYYNVFKLLLLVVIITVFIVVVGVLLQTIYNYIIKYINSDSFKKLVLKDYKIKK